MSQYHYHDMPRFRFARPTITWAVQRLILFNVMLFTVQLALDIPSRLYIDAPLLDRVELYPYSDAVPGGYTVNTVLGFQSDLFVRGQIWKPLTYQFLHGGLSHLFFNMLLLFFFGPGLERILGTPQFFRFYVACGAVAVLANLIPDFLSPFPVPSVLGASGAVMGVVVAFILVDPDRQFFLFPLPIPITGRALILLLVVVNVAYGLLGSGVSVATHFGGMGFGYAYMKLLPRYNAWHRERRFRRPPRRPGTASSPLDKVGDAVDNIFKFKNDDRS